MGSTRAIQIDQGIASQQSKESKDKITFCMSYVMTCGKVHVKCRNLHLTLNIFDLFELTGDEMTSLSFSIRTTRKFLEDFGIVCLASIKIDMVT